MLGEFVLWWLVLFASLALLVVSSGWLITNADKLGHALRMSPALVGLTVLAFGTSLPELASSLVGIFQGFSDIVIANLIGSNIANALFVLGILGFFSSYVGSSKSRRANAFLLIGSAALFTVLIVDGSFSVLDGLLSLSVVIVALFLLLKQQNTSTPQTPPRHHLSSRLFGSLFASTALLGVSAYGVVFAVSTLATLHQVSNAIVTITAVALGTSLPELTVSLLALLRKEVAVSLGNLVGSNVLNLLAVSAISSFFVTLPVETTLIFFALPVMFLATVLMAVFPFQGYLKKWQAFSFLVLYAVFLFRIWG